MLDRIPYNRSIMKAEVKLDHLKTEQGKYRISRNLCKILNIRIISVDVPNRILSFVFQNQLAFEQVKKELKRLGYPIKEILQVRDNRKQKRSDLEKWSPSL